MKTNFNISESEKNRILNLHKKEIIKEETILKLLREQQEKEVEGLINNTYENDDHTKWQQIIDKVENTGEDVVTFIKKMQNKELAKKFTKFLKNNFNKVKFKQQADKVVSLFNRIIGKQQPTPQPTSTPTPQPTSTPEVEDPNNWKYDIDKQKEYLLKNGYTEDSLNSFIGKRSNTKSGYNSYIENINDAITEVFKATYYEPITNIEEVSVLNMPKTMNQYFDLIKKYGFEEIDVSSPENVKKYFNLPNPDANQRGISEYIAKSLGWGTYNFKSMYGNSKTRVVTWYEDANKIVRIGQTDFTNNRTDQKTTFKPKSIGNFPLIGSDENKTLNQVWVNNFKDYILDPEIVQWEDYEDADSIVNKYNYIRSWWIENGTPKYKNVGGKIFNVDGTREYTDKHLSFITPGVTKDIKDLEDAINKYFKGEELQKQLVELEKLKNEARGIKFYN